MRNLSSSLFCIVLSGCASHPVCSDIVVSTLPQQQAIQRPTLAVETLRGNASEGEVAIAWKTTVDQLINYSKQLEIVVDGYNKMTKENKK